MDLNYLLWLQDIRTVTHDALTPFIAGISTFSTSYLLCVPVLIYWCWDKKRGLLTLASLYLCLALTSVIKLTACVYRPWIKDPRIIPAVKSLPKSYSFPSRHTSMGSVICLGTALTCWQKKRSKMILVLCILLALLIGFSRNYLGVHTPQDVGVGFLLSIGCLYAVWKTANYLEKHPEKENLLLASVVVGCILVIGYIVYKPYPLDYVNGKLLVSPQKMMTGGFECMGALLAFCLARYVEKTWIRFEETGLNRRGILCGLLGLIPLYLLFDYTAKPLKHLLGNMWGPLVWSACLVIYIVALYPFVLKGCSSQSRV